MSLLKSSRRRHQPKFTPVNKRLNFDLNASPPTSAVVTETLVVPCDNTQFMLEMELDQLEELDLMTGESCSVKTAGSSELDNFSPMRTRSGCVYESGMKKRKFRLGGTKKKFKRSAANGASTAVGGGLRSRAASGQSGTGSVADCSENGSEHSDDNLHMGICDRLDFQLNGEGPYGDYDPSSRFTQARERKHRHDIPSSPIHNQHHMIDNELSSPVSKLWNPHMDPHSPTLSFSPPTNTMRAMRLFCDGGLTSPNTACAALTSPRSTPRLQTLKSRLIFGEDGEHRRASLPNPQIFECDTTTGSARKTANINPFTPAAMILASKKRSRTKRSMDSSVGSSREELQASLDSLEGEEESDYEDLDIDHSQAKRIRVADINITRYELEFLELGEIATGQFGVVKKSRHCLDGIVYAIKISKNPLRNNSHDEKMAMNEVFAHAAMMKHKHVVRYYNSWVERGQVYIQNEFCEGGSLTEKINEFRETGQKFSEQELKKIIIHVCKGLQYIHSKQLVHLDIKPGNIFISLEYSSPSPNSKNDNNSTDSGAASGDSPLPSSRNLDNSEEGSSPVGGSDEKVHYKIGDLGHVASVWGGFMAPEEGDCRYMAPELLQMEPERNLLPKADIFSLGLTMFEAASLQQLPRNSGDGALYERLKIGDLPYLEGYSREFNNLLKNMVHPDPLARPTASKLLTNSSLNPSMNKTRSQLYKELREYKEKVARLELQLATSSGSSMHPVNNARPVITRYPKLGLDKENNEPMSGISGVLAKRLVGRGATRSNSCLM